MPVIFREFIYRQDLRDNPDWLFIFGDNDLRLGYGGQAKEMRGEPNAVGVRTKWAPGMLPQDFFKDRDYVNIVAMIDYDLRKVKEKLQEGGVVVFPLAGLGTGLSQLPERAPRVNEYLVKELRKLAETFS